MNSVQHITKQKSEFMKSIEGSLILKLLIAAYALVYFTGFFIPVITENKDSLLAKMGVIEYYTVPAAFLLFLVGAVYVHFNERTGGIILLVWHFVVWFLSMFFWNEAGMVLILIFPMLFPPIFLIRNWYIRNDTAYQASLMKWKLVLKILLINYAAIYLIIIASEIVQKAFHIPLRNDLNNSTTWDYSLLESGILFFELGLFMAACILSLRHKRIAGLLLIIWYIIIVLSCQQFFEIGNSGPWILFSVPLIIQGVLYFVVDAKEKEMNIVS